MLQLFLVVECMSPKAVDHSSTSCFSYASMATTEFGAVQLPAALAAGSGTRRQRRGGQVAMDPAWARVCAV